MSSDATAYVWRYSPFKLTTFAVHHAIADSVNDQYEYRCWLTQEALAQKTRSSVRSVADALAALEDGGWLKRLSGGQKAGSAIQFRFVFKRHVEAVYLPKRAVDNGSAKTADPPAKSADGSAKTADRTEALSPEPSSSTDSLKLVREPGSNPARQIKSNLRNRGAA